MNDLHYMEMAARAAARGLGRVAPNPAVGCVIVDAMGEVLAIARTGDGGRPHAEHHALTALAEQGKTAHGASVYVTLEPCAHEGQTPSCARLLVEAGVKRVVIAHGDPDPRTAGQGEAYLQAHGVQTQRCPNGRAAHVLNGYLLRQSRHRPAVTLKIALSANGFMRTPEGQSPQITGALARRFVHGLRARHDGLLTGSGTVLADNPQLTCRLPAMRSPDCFVVDRRGRFPQGCHLDRAGVRVFTDQSPAVNHAELLPWPGPPDRQTRDPHIRDENERKDNDLLHVLHDLARRGMNRLMVEAGPTLSRAIWQSGTVDQLLVLTAPHNLSMDGPSDAAYIGLNNVPRDYNLFYDGRLGDDHLVIWRRPYNEGDAPNLAKM